MSQPVLGQRITSSLSRAAFWAGAFALTFLVLAVLLVSASLQSNKQYMQSHQGILPTIVTAIAAAVFFAQSIVLAGVSYYAAKTSQNIEDTITRWTKRVTTALFGARFLQTVIGGVTEKKTGVDKDDTEKAAPAASPVHGSGGQPTEAAGGAAANGTTTPSFESDIKTLFRPSDVEAMKSLRGFDLHKYEDVKEKADLIATRLNDESRPMPCDGLWPPAKRALFQQWIETGMQP